MAKVMVKKVALITDGRFSGGTRGFCIGHIGPEAAEGGPIGLLEDGDQITIDAINGTIDVDLSDEELAERKKGWKPERMIINQAHYGNMHKLLASHRMVQLRIQVEILKNMYMQMTKLLNIDFPRA